MKLTSELVGRLILAALAALAAWWLVGACVALVVALFVPVVSVVVLALMMWALFLRDHPTQDLAKTLAPRTYRQNVPQGQSGCKVAGGKAPSRTRASAVPGNHPILHSGNFKARP